MVTRRIPSTLKFVTENIEVADRLVISGTIRYRSMDSKNGEGGKMTTVIAESVVLGERNMKARGLVGPAETDED
jgi:single-stranded DNA-binding protein